MILTFIGVFKTFTSKISKTLDGTSPNEEIISDTNMCYVTYIIRAEKQWSLPLIWLLIVWSSLDDRNFIEQWEQIIIFGNYIFDLFH